VRITVQVPKETQANLRVRVPSWASGEMEVLVNGKVAAKGRPGSYVALDRRWTGNDSIGDTIEFRLPASIRVTRYKGEEQIAGKSRYAVEYGPVLLAAVGSSKVELVVDQGKTVDDLGNLLEPVAGSPLHFTVRGNPGVKFVPYWQISDEEFTCYPVVTG
jgi:uncharacterized protein